MNRATRKQQTVMTGMEIIEMVEKRAAIRAVVVEARGKVEKRIASVVLLVIGAGAFRFFGWRAVAALVVYQTVTGVRAYQNWKRVQREAAGS